MDKSKCDRCRYELTDGCKLQFVIKDIKGICDFRDRPGE